MSQHKINLKWERKTPDFNYKTYDRTHKIHFSGGSDIYLAAAPEFLGNPEITNPEELMVAALSSCHMLTFLAIASMKNLIVDSYDDDAEGLLAKTEGNKMALTQVTLRPKVVFGGDNKPDAAAIDQMHHKAHENCFIANSVTTKVHVEPQ